MQLKKRNRKINMQEENGKKGICMILSLLLFSTHTVPQLNHFDSFIFFNLLDGEDKWRRLGRQLTAVMVSPAKRFLLFAFYRMLVKGDSEWLMIWLAMTSISMCVLCVCFILNRLFIFMRFRCFKNTFDENWHSCTQAHHSPYSLSHSDSGIHQCWYSKWHERTKEKIRSESNNKCRLRIEER